MMFYIKPVIIGNDNRKLIGRIDKTDLDFNDIN